ncbi:hypothetical protein AC1031_007057 [Aphanomyces cochlioides]|nr:hypothetical protein AC1031_007057 [Aphanomyces cochlioides]
MAGLVVVVVYGWELVVALASWVYSIVVAACSKVKTTAMKTRTVATKTRTTTVKTTIAAEMARPEFDCMDNRDQNIKTANEFGFVRCTRGRCLLLVSGVLLLLFGCVALATHDGNIELHNLTSASRNNSSIDVVTGLADDGKAWLAVDDGASRPVSIASIRDSPGGSQKTAQRDDPMLESKLDRLGCIVVTMFGVAATTAGHVLKLWVGYGVMSSLLQLYSS